MNTEYTFWSRVAKTDNNDECWEWLGGFQSEGYGIMSYQGKLEYAHRLSVLFTTGSFPEKFGLHSCDNRSCVNPNHIHNGTREDNLKEAMERNRIKKGEQHWSAKLTERKIKEIKALIKNKTYSFIEIGKMFDVGEQTISRIANNRTWKHLDNNVSKDNE